MEPSCKDRRCSKASSSVGKESTMPAMIVLINLREGVIPEKYERWILRNRLKRGREAVAR